MRQQLMWPFIALLALFTASGCQKSDVITNEQSLEGTWTITGIVADRAYDFNGDGQVETDIYATYTPCQRDIVLVFQANGYGQVRQGCTASWQHMSWQLSNNNRRLSIGLPDDDLHLAISQFDTYTLRGTDQVQLNGSTYSITYTLQRR